MTTSTPVGDADSAPDLAVVGAGPAGLGAAIEARRAGLSVVVIDDQAEPGGQIWRAAGSADAAQVGRLGPEYAEGRRVIAAFLGCGATYLPGRIVWNIEREPRLALFFAGDGGGAVIRPKTLLLATGALERPFPAPGWTLPGVMTAGGAQILLKTANLVADDAVLAGAGPLLWLLAAQMAEAGSPPRAVVELAPHRRYLSATAHLPRALGGFGPLAKGLKLIAKVRASGAALHFGARDFRIDGTDAAQAVSFADRRGARHSIGTTFVALHCGVIPNQQATRLMRLPHDWDPGQHAFLPRRGADLRIAEGVYLAGDGARIGGAQVAYLEGRLAARIISGAPETDLRAALRKARAARPFLDHLYAPPREALQPADDTLVCRCEAVTAGALRRAANDGAIGPNQAKFLLRAGMGPCQGRVCGMVVSEVIAGATKRGMAETGYFRIRPPLKPLGLGAIAKSGAG